MTTLLEKSRNGETVDVDIIDTHGHLGLYQFGIPNATADILVENMDRIGVNKIMCSSLRTISPDIRLGNEELYAGMQAYPDRILGYVILWPDNHESVQNECEYWLDKGFTGIKLHTGNGHRYAAEPYHAAYAIANERKLPFLFHVWGVPTEFEDIIMIAEKYPDISIIMAHTGSYDLDGYIRIAQAFDNVYLEICYSLAPNGLIDTLCERIGSEKVLYGSDCHFYSMTQQIGRVLGAKCSDEEKTNILGGNAQKMLDRIAR